MKLLMIPVFLCILFSGCMPVVIYDTCAPKLRGQVRSLKTGKPVADVAVNIKAYDVLDDEDTTDEDGRFSVGPLLHWYYLVYLGSPGVWPLHPGFNSSSCYPIYLHFHKKKSFDFSFKCSFRYPDDSDPQEKWDNAILIIPCKYVVKRRNGQLEYLINRSPPDKLIIKADPMEIIFDNVSADFR